MNEYKVFYKDYEFSVKADTTLGAREKAITILKLEYHVRRQIKPWDITVLLANMGGRPYIQPTDF